MATGGMNLTTWKAKRLVGDSGAAADALIQSGTGVTTDIWLFKYNERSSDSGILYQYTGNSNNDQLKFIDNGITISKSTTTSGDNCAYLRLAVIDTDIGAGYEQGVNVLKAYHTHSSSQTGMNVVLNSGKNLFIGSGNAADNIYSLKYTAVSDLFLASDTAIYLEAGASTVANRVGLQIASSGNIIPMKAEVKNDNVQNLGASDARFANIYGVNFRGNLIGNADTATALKNLYDYNTRPTDANLTHVTNGGLVNFRATSSMVNNSPGTDGTILHCHWDTSDAWDSQLHIPNNANSSIHWRGSTAAGTWGNWYTVLDSSNYSSYISTMTSNLSISCSTSVANHASTPSAIYFKPHQTDNNLTYTGAYIAVYDDGDTANSGTNMVIRSGGNTIIGGGECASSIYTNAIVGNTANANISVGANAATFSETGENLILGADDAIYFLTNCNTIANRNLSYLTTAGYLYTTRTYNAVWNDYAEFRICDNLVPGTCVQEQDNGHLIIADKRLIPGASIISDTYGFAEGETETAKTPVAVTGRVLAYTYRDRSEYHAGQAVCSAPNGTVDIMTRDEIMMYPDAIIGIVSEIPDYDEWGSGNVKIDGRIWIKVK